MENHEDPRSSSSAFTTPSIIRESSSAFWKPILPSSSHLSPKPQFSSSTPDPSTPHYRECLKNHAASLGGHVIDGCGEFMPAGPADPLKCAACGCHRSFHRQEPEPESPSNLKPSYRVPLLLAPHPNPIMFNGYTNTNSSADQSSSEERVNYTSTNNNVGNYNHGSGSEGRKKRFRTKLSGEQKEKMKALAERVGWRVQKKDEGEMERFCNGLGISRQVLRVWMHNNKHLVKKQEGSFEGREIKGERLIQRQNLQEGNGA